MSFVRTYTFSEDVTFHWSAGGQSGSETKSVDVDVTVIVDTAPLERSAAAFATSMGALAAGTAAAGTAIVKEKRKSAERIASSLVSGFFKYIRYGIREQLAGLTARIPMLLKTLRGQADRALTVRSQMEQDYRRKTENSSAIFRNLTDRLEQSLQKLDAPVYEVSHVMDGLVFGSVQSTDTARALVGGPELAESATALQTSFLKDHAAAVISEGVRNIRYNQTLVEQIRHSLVRSRVAGEHSVLVPAIALRAPDLASTAPHADYHLPEGMLPDGGGFIRLWLKDNGPDAFLDIGAPAQDTAAVDSFFRKRLSSYVAERGDWSPERKDRFSSEVLRLWKQSLSLRSTPA